MGAGSGLGITGSVPNGAAGTENDIPAPTEIDFGDVYIRGFLFDNVLHSEGNGDIHFGLYIPESYDGSEPYALYVTLPGYEGLYFQGVGVNIRAEDYGIEAQKYNERMIIVAPQLNDWKETSARQTIALTRYFLGHYHIDLQKVYLNGYSGGAKQDPWSWNSRRSCSLRSCIALLSGTAICSLLQKPGHPSIW